MRFDAVTKFVRSLPESTDEPHDDWTSFKVRGKRFASATPDGRYLHVAVDDDETRACVADDPGVFAEWWTGGNLCLRVDLKGAASARVRELLIEAWLRKAPKRLAATLPRPSGT